MYSGSDEHVPKKIDKVKLLERWRAASNKFDQEIWDGKNSGIIPGASHNLGGSGEDEARQDLVNRVKGYLEDITAST